MKSALKLGSRARLLLIGIAAIVPFVAVPVVRADPLQFSVSTTDAGTPINQSVGGNNLLDLVNDMIDQQARFAAFSGRAYDANVGYLGVNNALQFSSNAAGTSVTLQIPSTGFSRTFTGATSDDVQQQIEDFLKKDGSAEYAKFMKSINETSQLAPIDGNPQATTAWLNSGAFARYAFEPAVGERAFETGGGTGFNVRTSGGNISTDSGDANYAELSLEGNARFNSNVALSWAFPFAWRSADGADTYMGGFELGLPLTLIAPAASTAHSSFGWRITPFGQIALAGSEDLVAGGIVGGGGLTGAINFRIVNTTFTLGNQAAYYSGVPIDVSDYRFDTDVDQIMLRNGLKVTQDIGDRGFVDAGVIYTNFLNDAAVTEYLSPTVGAGIRFGKGMDSGLRIAYQGDFGDGYTSHGGTLLVWLSW